MSIGDETIDVCFMMTISLTFPERTNNFQLDITARGMKGGSDPRGTLHVAYSDPR